MRAFSGACRIVGRLVTAFWYARRTVKIVILSVVAVLLIVGSIMNRGEVSSVEPTKEEQRQIQQDAREAERFKREAAKESRHGCTTRKVVTTTTTGAHPSRTTTVTRECS